MILNIGFFQIQINPLKDINGTPGVILETVRSEVRQAISDLQYDLKNVSVPNLDWSLVLFISSFV